MVLYYIQYYITANFRGGGEIESLGGKVPPLKALDKTLCVLQSDWCLEIPQWGQARCARFPRPSLSPWVHRYRRGWVQD